MSKCHVFYLYFYYYFFNLSVLKVGTHLHIKQFLNFRAKKEKEKNGKDSKAQMNITFQNDCCNTRHSSQESTIGNRKIQTTPILKPKENHQTFNPFP